MSKKKNSNHKQKSRTAPSPVVHVAGKTTTRKEIEKQWMDALRDKKTKNIFWLIVMVLLLVVSINTWRCRADLSCRNMARCAGDTGSLSGHGENKARLSGSVYKSSAFIGTDFGGMGIAVLTDSCFSIYNGSLKQVKSNPHFMASPAMRVSGQYALVYDTGGKSLVLESLSETILSVNGSHFEEMVGGPAACGAVSRSGDFAVSTNTSDQISTVSVFSPAGKLLYRWGAAEFYVTNLALSPNGNHLAVAGINARDGKYLTTVTVLRVGYEQAFCRIELPDFEPIALGYVKSGYLFVVGDQESYVIDPGDFNPKKIETGTLSSYSFDYDSGAAFYAQISDKEGLLTVYDTIGGKRFEKNVGIRAADIALSNGKTAVLGSGNAAFFSPVGSALPAREIPHGCRAILLRGSNVYLIHNTEIARI